VSGHLQRIDVLPELRHVLLEGIAGDVSAASGQQQASEHGEDSEGESLRARQLHDADPLRSRYWAFTR
jgi:hypothetical protein